MDFVCDDPKATVRAANVRATLDAFKLVPSIGKKLVEKHRLPADDLRPDKRVPVQSWLDALREIQAVVGPEMLRSVGAAVIENADFPPHFDSVESVLMALDVIYHLNHEGEVGHYRVRKLPDGAIEVGCETPYPRKFEQGLVEGISRLTKGTRHLVEYQDGDPSGARTCTLIVRSAAR
jgi:hypothetical protein